MGQAMGGKSEMSSQGFPPWNMKAFLYLEGDSSLLFYISQKGLYYRHKFIAGFIGMLRFNLWLKSWH